ncbi:site-specific integrase [bacterium]|nr:site-specific integrase [bacterium]
MSWERSQRFEQKLSSVPEPLRKQIHMVRDRVHDIIKKFGSLKAYGNPVFEDIKEVASIYVANKQYKVPYDILARYMGLNPVSLFRMLRRIEEGRVTLYVNGTRETIHVTPEELKEITNKMVKPKASRNIADVTQASVIQEWLKRPVRRSGGAKFGKFLGEKQIRTTLNIVKRIANYIREYRHDLPVNPDLWKEEDIAKIIEEMKARYNWSDQHVRSIKIALRRIFPGWFTHEVGSAKSVARPKETYIPYQMFMQILESDLFTDLEKLYLKLHVTTGAREGIGASEPSSMWGLRWDMIDWTNGVIKIYESKTKKEWRGRLDLFFPELPRELYNLWVKLGKPTGYIWQTLNYTKHSFDNMIHKVARKIREMFSDQLKEMFGTDKIVPHDLRRTHVVWLIDAGVDLETIAKSDEFDLGVGWENLDTLLIYYARFTQRRRAIELSKVYLRYHGDIPDNIVKMSGLSKDELIKIVRSIS